MGAALLPRNIAPVRPVYKRLPWWQDLHHTLRWMSLRVVTSSWSWCGLELATLSRNRTACWQRPSRWLLDVEPPYLEARPFSSCPRWDGLSPPSSHWSWIPWRRFPPLRKPAGRRHPLWLLPGQSLSSDLSPQSSSRLWSCPWTFCRRLPGALLPGIPCRPSLALQVESPILCPPDRQLVQWWYTYLERKRKKENLFYTVMVTLEDWKQAGCCPIELKVHWNSHVRYYIWQLESN